MSGEAKTDRIEQNLLSLRLIFQILFTLLSLSARAETGKVMVLTDMEPDDQMAIHVLAANVPEKDILFFGATVMNAARKQSLLRNLLDRIGLTSTAAHQGTGGQASSYPDLSATKPAREYAHEGEGILSAGKLGALKGAERSSPSLQKAIYEGLKHNDGVEILLLSPPIDLVEVLEKHPELRSKIKQIHVMGGWAESKAETGETVRRTTYNWNMDPVGSHASARLMKLKDVPMTIYSYHAIKEAFPDRSVNPGNYPRVWQAIEGAQARMPSLRDTAVASRSWDGHALENLPPELPATHPLKAALTNYGGRQFAPADTLAVVGMLDPGLVVSARPVSITIDEGDVDPKTGIRVHVEDDATSKIRVVDKLDPIVFEQRMVNAFLTLPALGKPDAFPRREFPARLCRVFFQGMKGLFRSP